MPRGHRTSGAAVGRPPLTYREQEQQARRRAVADAIKSGKAFKPAQKEKEDK